MNYTKLKKTIYTSDKKTHFFKEIKEIASDIKNSNFLAMQIAKRDLQAQYRQSFLGFFWAFAPIVTNSLVWIFLNGSGAVNVNVNDSVPYALFVIIGTTLWSVFLESLQSPILSIESGKSILSKINFPKEALLIGGLYKVLFNLVLKSVLVIVFMIIYHVPLSTSLLYLPIFITGIIIFSSCIGIIIAPIGLLYSDIGRIISAVSSFLMYVTPVVFMVPRFGSLQTIFDINPLTPLINNSRNCILGLEVNDILYTIILTVVSTVILLFGLVVFRKSMPILIEKIS